MTDLPDHLHDVADAVSEVYPLGVAGDPYLCLVRVLDELLDGLSDDEIGMVLAECFDMEHAGAVRDVRRVRDIQGLDQEQCDEVRSLLNEAGVDA